MATALKLKNDIKKLKAAISSKATPKSFVPKLKAQLDKAENELASLKKSGRPRKTSTTKGTATTLSALQKLIQKKKFGVYQGAGVDLKKDAGEGAFATGRRVSKGLKSNQWGDASENKGNVYYEYRPNRLDVKQPKKKQTYPKLEKGGMMAKGGEVRYKLAGSNFGQQIENGKKFAELIKKAHENQTSEYKYPENFIKETAYTGKIVKNDGKYYLKDYSYKGTLDRFEFLGDKYFLESLKYLNRPTIKTFKFEDGGYMVDGGDPIPDDYFYIGSGEGGYSIKFKNKNDGSIIEVDNFDVDPISNRIIRISSQEALMRYFEKNFKDGGMMANGGEGSNLWVIYTKEWQKKPEIIEEFTATHKTAKNKLTKLQRSKPNSDVVYLMTDKISFYELYGDLMAKGGVFEKPIAAIMDKYGNIKSEKKLQQDLEDLKQAYQDKFVTKDEYDKSYDEIQEQIKLLQNKNKGGYMADGGELSDVDKEEFLDELYSYIGGNVQVVERKKDVQLSTENRASLSDVIKRFSPTGRTGWGGVSNIDEVKMDGDTYYYLTVDYRKIEDKMAKGGYMADGGKVKVGDTLTASTGVKVKVVEYDPMFGGRVKIERMDEYATGNPSQWMPLSKFKMADGGYMAEGDIISKTHKLG